MEVISSKRLGHARGEAFAVNGQRAARRQRRFFGAAQEQRPQGVKFGFEQTGGAVGQFRAE
jgi:hypothetical protein